jgi:excisionase family DNA binding protein
MSVRNRTCEDTLRYGGLVDALEPSPALSHQAQASIQTLLGMGFVMGGRAPAVSDSSHQASAHQYSTLCRQAGLQEEMGVTIGEAQIYLPGQIAKLAMEMLEEIANGNGVALVRTDGNVSTTRAAQLLGCSRPHVVKLVENGLLRASKVGSHRRISMSEIVRYKRERVRQETALLKLADISEEFEGLEMPAREAAVE